MSNSTIEITSDSLDNNQQTPECNSSYISNPSGMIESLSECIETVEPISAEKLQEIQETLMGAAYDAAVRLGALVIPSSYANYCGIYLGNIDISHVYSMPQVSITPTEMVLHSNSPAEELECPGEQSMEYLKYLQGMLSRFDKPAPKPAPQPTPAVCKRHYRKIAPAIRTPPGTTFGSFIPAPGIPISTTRPGVRAPSGAVINSPDVVVPIPPSNAPAMCAPFLAFDSTTPVMDSNIRAPFSTFDSSAPATNAPRSTPGSPDARVSKAPVGPSDIVIPIADDSAPHSTSIPDMSAPLITSEFPDISAPNHESGPIFDTLDERSFLDSLSSNFPILESPIQEPMPFIDGLDADSVSTVPQPEPVMNNVFDVSSIDVPSIDVPVDVPSVDVPMNVPTIGVSNSNTYVNDSTCFMNSSGPFPVSASTTRPKTAKRSKPKKPRKQSPHRCFPASAREILVSWIVAHRDHPYCSAAEKRELARKTGLAVSQITMWFINNRRRNPMFKWNCLLI